MDPLDVVFLSTEPRDDLLLLAPGTKNDASVPKRSGRDFGASGVRAYIVALWLAAEDESGKREERNSSKTDGCYEAPVGDLR